MLNNKKHTIFYFSLVFLCIGNSFAGRKKRQEAYSKRQADSVRIPATRLVVDGVGSVEEDKVQSMVAIGLFLGLLPGQFQVEKKEFYDAQENLICVYYYLIGGTERHCYIEIDEKYVTALNRVLEDKIKERVSADTLPPFRTASFALFCSRVLMQKPDGAEEKSNIQKFQSLLRAMRLDLDTLHVSEGANDQMGCVIAARGFGVCENVLMLGVRYIPYI